MNQLLEGLKALGLARLVAMGAVALGLLSLLAVLVLRGGADHMALLYGDLDLRESGQVVEQLTRQHIPYEIGAQGAQILVPSEQVARARVLLAREGLPSSGSIGYEIFDRNDGLTTTQFQQQIAETRAMEGEIARTIRTMHGVRGVRVHLVLPRREPFARERQEAQASVVLSMTGAAPPDREAVQAILNLVAAAVPGLKTQNIALVDTRGTVLARAGEATGAAVTAQSAEEIRRGTELRLSRAVEEMLEGSLGIGRVRAEAAVEMDFERVNETQERYDPDGQVPRSEQTVTTSNRSTEASPTVSVQNNLPNADAGTNRTGSQESRQEETTNFEIGRTVRTLIREQPQIHRISLAVMVDGTETPGPDGKPVWQPRPEAEMARITNLVKSVIGFDEKRGDQVQVVSMRFATPEDTTLADTGTLLGFRLEKPDFMRLAQTAVIGLVGILALLSVLRPMVLRLTQGLVIAGPRDVLAAAAPGAPASSGTIQATEALAMLEDNSMIDIANIEGQIRASSIRRIVELAEKHPEETLTVVRGWMAREGI